MNVIITLLRKPLEGTVARNVLQYSTGGLNIDGTRIESADPVIINTWDDGAKPFGGGAGLAFTTRESHLGRWPANLILTERAASGVDASTAPSVSRAGAPRTGVQGQGWGMSHTGAEYDDQGGVSRYFKIIQSRP